MTPQEQIAYLRSLPKMVPRTDTANNAILAVCDLAERTEEAERYAMRVYAEKQATEKRYALTDDEAEAVRAWLDGEDADEGYEIAEALLRRLLPDERVEHELLSAAYSHPGLRCSCGALFPDDHLDAAVRAWAAHAGIGRSPMDTWPERRTVRLPNTDD